MAKFAIQGKSSSTVSALSQRASIYIPPLPWARFRVPVRVVLGLEFALREGWVRDLCVRE